MELSFLTCLSVLADVLAHIYIIYVSCSAGSKHDVLYKKGGLHDKFVALTTPGTPSLFLQASPPADVERNWLPLECIIIPQKL